jgi:nucleotide-binding universal stress UspA family protein
MEIRDILLFLHAAAPNEAALQMAVQLGRAHGASIAGCCLCASPPMSLADSFAVGYAGDADVLDRRRGKIDTTAHPVEMAFRAAAAVSGVAADWLVPDPSEPPEALARRALFFDLAVVPRAPTPDHPARELAEALALRSGGPCLIGPHEPSPPPFERIVVAWNGSAQARRALDDALPLLKTATAVQLLMLGDGADQVAARRPDQVLRRLARHGINATPRVVAEPRRPTAAALAEACADFDAGLLVMGAYSHGRAGELVLGGATRDVLADFPVAALLSR